MRFNSETEALRHPVMPVADGFSSRLARANGNQLKKGNRHIPAMLADQHEHVA